MGGVRASKIRSSRRCGQCNRARGNLPASTPANDVSVVIPIAGATRANGQSDRRRDSRFPRKGANTNEEGGWM
jgi:hypothetical protein